MAQDNGPRESIFHERDYSGLFGDDGFTGKIEQSKKEKYLAILNQAYQDAVKKSGGKDKWDKLDIKRKSNAFLRKIPEKDWEILDGLNGHIVDRFFEIREAPASEKTSQTGTLRKDHAQSAFAVPYKEHPDHPAFLHHLEKEPIPNGTSPENSSLVSLKQETLEHQAQFDISAPPKRAKVVFSIERMVDPMDVEPPIVTRPAFVACDHWLDDVTMEIQSHLGDTDAPEASRESNNDSLYRVPPMALVRCSRGGKTRALYQIANAMRGYNTALDADVASLYISFNDYSAIAPWEQEDPLQAVLRRVAFMACHRRGERNPKTFHDFLADKPLVDVKDFLEWLGNTPCVLLIDELNNLKLLQDRASSRAADFGDFLKYHFIGMENRYLVYSSHVLATLEFFSLFVDTSNASSRAVVLQPLPLVPSLEEATKLKGSLDSVREAMYYGLMPGMIYESDSRGKCIAGKRRFWVSEALKNHSSNLDKVFLSILESLINGYMNEDFPQELGSLLDSVPDNAQEIGKVRWVPYHLQYVMHRLSGSSCTHARLAGQLSDYCNLLKDSKEISGEGWEDLFVLFLVARCFTCKGDGLIVNDLWFETGAEEVEVMLNGYNASANRNQLFSTCQTWDQLKAGIVSGTKQFCLNILYPTHNNFRVYDVIVVFFAQGKACDVRGYQLKQGKVSTKHHVHKDMSSSFFVQGIPPKNTVEKDRKGWTIPGSLAISAFFGESGTHWTPENWKSFQRSSPSVP